MVSVLMGSTSDLEVMSAAFTTLEQFGIPYEKKVISAHRAPKLLDEYVSSAKDRGVKVIIAGAGAAAALPGVAASLTTIPVIGVPIAGKAFGGLDALLSMVQMPPGIPVATVSVGGSKNAALLAVSILALSDKTLSDKLDEFRAEQTRKIENTVI